MRYHNGRLNEMGWSIAQNPIGKATKKSNTFTLSKVKALPYNFRASELYFYTSLARFSEKVVSQPGYICRQNSKPFSSRHLGSPLRSRHDRLLG